MLRCWKAVLVKGGMMVLKRVSKQVRQMLHLTSLDMVWHIYDTRQEAIEALLTD